jgi:class 3 adenylate cyclase
VRDLGEHEDEEELETPSLSMTTSESRLAASADEGESPCDENKATASLEGTPSTRRSHRSRNATISYADIDDFDSAAESDTSPVSAEPTVGKDQRVTATSAKPSSSADSRQGPFLSPSVKKHFRESKRGSRRSRLLVKSQPTDPTEIQDIAQGRVNADGAAAVAHGRVSAFQADVDTCESLEEDFLPASRLSPGAGKYFSVVDRTESPSGTIKIKLNRVVKHSHKTESPPLVTAGSCRTGGETAPVVARSVVPSTAYRIPVPRFSRSKTKDLGISPQELVQFMAAASPPKVIKDVVRCKK